MKKILFFVMVFALLASSCKKESKSKSLNYYDYNPIEMVLRGTHQIEVSSDYGISYKAINPDDKEVVSVTGGGKLTGENVGTAQVKIDNGYESRTIDVVVDFFAEPTFEFGCTTQRIRYLYGMPTVALNIDTLTAYYYTTDHGFSFICGEMDFYFYNGIYDEADLYIKSFPPNDDLLYNYLNERFDYDTIYGDTLQVYKYKLDPNILCGKFASHNQWDEWCLFYIRLDGEKSLANVLKRRPRSSKFLY